MPLRIAVVTYAPTTWDSRVQRTIDAIICAGHHAILVSPGDSAAINGQAEHIRLPLYNATRQQVIGNLCLMLPATVMRSMALPMHRLHPIYNAAYNALEAAAPDIIHANDWITLPAAVDAARKTGGKIIYDSHEFATGEHAERAWWRFAARPHIRAIESEMILHAEHVITVSDGLAQTLRELYGSSIKALTVIRNLPNLPARHISRPADDQIRLAYAGLIRPERCIEAMIEALAQLDGRYSLQITGFGPDKYIQRLKQLAQSCAVTDRVFWHAPVQPKMLVAHLAQADIGLFLSQGRRTQEKHALPNKIFEYTAAGLALVTSGSTDIQGLIRERHNGVFLQSNTPDDIAQAILGMDKEMLQGMKDNALATAKNMNWNIEQHRLVDIYQQIA